MGSCLIRGPYYVCTASIIAEDVVAHDIQCICEEAWEKGPMGSHNQM